MDYSKYFRQGKKVRQRPLREEDAEHAYANSLDSPSRRVLQLGVGLLTPMDIKEQVAKFAGCRDVERLTIFKTGDLAQVLLPGTSLPEVQFRMCRGQRGVDRTPQEAWVRRGGTG